MNNFCTFLTVKSGYALALRAASVNMAACGMGTALLDKVSRDTVLRRTTECAAAVIASSQAFNQSMWIYWMDHHGHENLLVRGVIPPHLLK